MKGLRTLTAHPRFALHGLYCFLSLLVVIFLIFSAVSGPATKYFWLDLTLKPDSKTDQPGLEWRLGGLGSCRDVCNVEGPHTRVVHGILIWHLTSASVFALTAIIQAALVLRPLKNSPILGSWLTLLLPPIAFFLILTTVIADFAVRAGISGRDDAEEVRAQGSFWLSTVAAVFCLLWMIVAEYAMWRERRVRKEDKSEEVEEREMEKPGGVLNRFNPWRS